MIGRVVLAVGLLSAAALAGRSNEAMLNPVTTAKRIEAHHSLHPPLDKSQVYWKFGGSTVLTKNSIRLTPATQDRRGWLWNEYPLESENWEVEFKVEVFSKPHFGGDGFAFWVLGNGTYGAEQDPAFSQDPDALTGPLFGMRNTFQGIGVIFDVYDNDNRRNNPAVFVVRNDGPGPFMYNHDNDFENDMVTQKPTSIVGLDVDTRRTHQAHRCVADLRNTGKPTKVLVKFLHKVLSVYIDTQTAGYKFCLAVAMDRTFVDHHMAFTGATGQVADNQDLLEVTTRYLDVSDLSVDYSKYGYLGDSSGQHRFSGFFWTVITLAGLGLTAFAGYELATFRQMMATHLDTVRFCQQFNQYILPHYAAHAGVTLLMLLSGNWWLLLLNLPLLGLRAHQYLKKQHLYTATNVAMGPKQSGNPLQLPLQTRLIILLAFYLFMQVLYLNRLMDAI